MYGFEESEATRRLDKTTTENKKGTIIVRIKSKDIFGFTDREKTNMWIGL